MAEGEVAGKSYVDNKEEEMKEFYQHLIRHSQSGAKRIFVAGSRGEIPGQEYMSREYRFSPDLLDVDYMICSTNIYVSTPRVTVPDQFNGRVISICSHGLHAGYAKLLHADFNTEFKRTDLALVTRGNVLRGPAETSDIASRRESEAFTRFVSEETWKARVTDPDNIAMQDYVFAVHSRCWPIEMNEWITRRRLSGLPSKSIIKQVVRYGCDFVPVSHKLSTDMNEWRFSFSKAELIIIHCWTASQRCVYRTLHTLNKMINTGMEDSKLCSYYFKTLMLWATEEKPAEFWSDQALVSSVCVLLHKLMDWLERRFCPNYFIPTNNMIDHLSVAALSEGFHALYRLSQNRLRIADVLSASRYLEALVSNKKYYIKVPVWMYTSLLINEQLYGSEDMSTRLFTKSSAALIDRAMSIQLSDIYHGLHYYKMAGNSLIQSDNYYLMKSIDRFHRYGISDTAQATVVVCCSSNIAERVLATSFMHYEPDTNESLSLLTTSNAFTSADSWSISDVDNNKMDEKCLLYSRSMDNVDQTMATDVYFNENICGNNKTTVILYWTSTVDNETYTGAQFYKGWNGMSPTMNISWFINNTYLANLYYKTLWDYRAAEEICDDIIYVCKQSYCNHAFAESALPVILSTDWTSVYDEGLQAMLGLYSLCSFMFNKTDRGRSVYLGICPVLFALYLKCRCAADQIDIKKWNKCVVESNEHFQECKCDNRARSGRLAVNMPLMVTQLTFKRLLEFLVFQNNTKIFQEFIIWILSGVK